VFTDKLSREALSKRLMALVFDVQRSYDQGSTRPGWVYVSDQLEGDIIAAAAVVLAQPAQDEGQDGGQDRRVAR
jgi:hypothetical protein